MKSPFQISSHLSLKYLCKMTPLLVSYIFCAICLQVPTLECSPAVTTLSTLTGNSIDGEEYEDVEHHTLAPGSPDIEVKALTFLKDVNNRSFYAYRDFVVASWNYETGITEITENTKSKAEADNYKFEADIQKEVEKNFPKWESYQDPVLKKMFSNFAVQGPGNMSQCQIEKMTELLTKMESSFSTTTICDFHDKSKCDLRIDRDIGEKLASSKDLAEKVYYWKEWHNAMSKEIPPSLYKNFVNYQNEMAKANDFENMGVMWITQYNDYSDDWTPEGFKEEIGELEKEIRPFYNKLHAYVRMKLRKNPAYADKIPKSGLLPVELLGNMWGQDWIAVDEATKPYQAHDLSSDLATKALKKAGYTVDKLFKEADQFFADLGLMRVPETFWEYSRFERPKDGREVVCHPSAWYFINSTDVRITMCAKISLDDLLTIHHEMGHIQYFLQYRSLPHVFQDGANPGFHEAIGDSIALSIMTPTHLQCRLKLDLGLSNICKENGEQSKNKPIEDWEINFLYITALQKIPFLSFSYSLETWRWKAFNMSIKAEEYNKEWWKIRAKLQGVVPPENRDSPNLFDPAAKFHIASNEPYISYFVSSILQFQFYEAMCKAATQYDETSEANKPLYRCDISGSKAAGKLLGDMMKLGCSTDWRSALEVMTGSRKMSAKPLLDYFKPLFQYIDEELAKNKEEACYGEYCSQKH